MGPPSSREVAERLLILKHCVIYSAICPPPGIVSQLMSTWPAEERRKFVLASETKRDEFWQGLRELGLWDRFSPSEQEFASTTMVSMTERQRINASWRMQAAAVLIWALGRVDGFPSFDTEVPPESLKPYPGESPSEFLRDARVRPHAEIDRMRDVAELWHWRSRTRELEEQGAVFPVDDAMRKAGIQSFDDVVRMTAKMAFADQSLGEIVDDDFVAFGKAYRSLTDAEWSSIRSITMERHFALNWLCGYAPDNRWDDTPTDT
jgi:hypothetical protein